MGKDLNLQVVENTFNWRNRFMSVYEKREYLTEIRVINMFFYTAKRGIIYFQSCLSL